MKKAFLNVAGVGTSEINADGIYTFTPIANYNGLIPTTSYTVSDGNGGTGVAKLNLIIIFKPVNDVPDAKYDKFITPKVTLVTNDILVNDSDTESVEVIPSIIFQPQHNNAMIDQSGKMIYTPNPNFDWLDKLIR